jgi:hypothetical protein
LQGYFSYKATLEGFDEDFTLSNIMREYTISMTHVLKSLKRANLLIINDGHGMSFGGHDELLA